MIDKIDKYSYIIFYAALFAMLFVGGGVASLLIFLLWLVEIFMVFFCLLGMSDDAPDGLIESLAKKQDHIIPKRILYASLVLALAYQGFVITSAMMVVAWIIRFICISSIRDKQSKAKAMQDGAL